MINGSFGAREHSLDSVQQSGSDLSLQVINSLLKVMNYLLKVMNSVLKVMNCVLKVMNSVIIVINLAFKMMDLYYNTRISLLTSSSARCRATLTRAKS